MPEVEDRKSVEKKEEAWPDKSVKEPEIEQLDPSVSNRQHENDDDKQSAYTDRTGSNYASKPNL